MVWRSARARGDGESNYNGWARAMDIFVVVIQLQELHYINKIDSKSKPKTRPGIVWIMYGYCPKLFLLECCPEYCCGSKYLWILMWISDLVDIVSEVGANVDIVVDMA